MKTTKKIVALFLAVLMVFSVVSVSMTAFAATKKVTKVTLSKTSATLYTTKTLALTAKVSPSNASNKKITWSSSDKKIATVSSKGVVKGVKAGKVTITAKAADGSGKKATCKITVKKFVKITSMKLNYTSKTVNVGDSVKLKVTAKPSNASILTYKWTSSNTKVATVNSTGTVKGVKAGTATITAAATDGSGKKVTCKVTVKNVPVSSIKLNKTSVTVYPAKTYTLKATVSPSNATNPAVKWTSSDTTAATVTSTGVVKGIKAGKTATITCAATDGSGKKATCKVTVGVYATDMYVHSSTEPDSSWYVGKKGKLSVVVLPDNTTNKKVTWTSSDSKYATVDANGNVEILKIKTNWRDKPVETKVTMTATATDGSGVTAKYDVVINEKKSLNSLKVADTVPSDIYVGQKQPFSVVLDPVDASERALKYTSSNTAVATVDAAGNIKALAAGTVTITATSTYDTTKKVSKAFTVKPVEMLYTGISNKQGFYAVGDIATITSVINPTEALEYIGLTFESEDPSVAKIIPTSKSKASIEFLKAGKTRVRAVASDGKLVSPWIEVEVREMRFDKDFFQNVNMTDMYVVDAYMFNGQRVTSADINSGIVWENSDYFTVIENEDGQYMIFVNKELPEGGAKIKFKSEVATSKVAGEISFMKGSYTTPSGSKTELLNTFKNYTATAKTAKSSFIDKTVAYSNTNVDESKSKTEMTVNGMSLDIFLKIMGAVIGDDEDIMSEMSPKTMIDDLFSGESKETDSIDAKQHPGAVTVSEADVKSITVTDNGGATYQMKLTLNDQKDRLALDAVSSSAYGKTMKVIDKAFLDNYKDQLDISGSELGEDATTSLNYGTVTQKYTGGYVVLTIDKLTDKVVSSEYHYKSDIKVDKAVFKMAAKLSDSGLSLNLGVTLTAYFTTNVETTAKYSSYKY